MKFTILSDALTGASFVDKIITFPADTQTLFYYFQCSGTDQMGNDFSQGVAFTVNNCASTIEDL
jgi:hypothetical protein